VAIGAATGQIHTWKDVGRLAAVGFASGAILGGGGYLLGPGALALAGTAKTFGEIGLSVASGMIGGGLDSHMQGAPFSRGLLPGAIGGLAGYGMSLGLGAVFRISAEPPNPAQIGNQVGLAQQTRQFLNETGLGSQGAKSAVAISEDTIPAGQRLIVRPNGQPQTYYPPNRGFIGESARTTLTPGTIIDRYGEPMGRFASPQGTPIGARSLPPGSAGFPLRAYRVLKPLDVDAGRAAPWFGQFGCGTQYCFDQSIKKFIDSGYLEAVQ